MPHAERSPLEEPVHDAADFNAPLVLDEGQPMPQREMPAPLIDNAVPMMGSTVTPLDTAIATPADVVRAIEKLLALAHEAQQEGVALAFKELHDNSKPAPSWITEVIASVAELVVTLPLGQLGGLIANALMGAGDSTKGVVSQLARFAAGFGRSAHGEVVEQLGAGDRDDTGLLEKYQTEVTDRVKVMQGRAEVDLILAGHQLEKLPANVLGRMAERLRPTMELRASLREEQHKAVMFGWMHVCAGLSQNGDEAVRTGVDGFVDVYISCPERLDGARGCEVERVDVNSHPRVASMVKGLARTVLAVPVHRRVFLSIRGTDAGLGWSEPSYELDPDHHITVLPNASLLASLGSGGVVASGDLKRDIEQHQALAGAAIVNDLLSNTPLRSTR